MSEEENEEPERIDAFIEAPVISGKSKFEPNDEEKAELIKQRQIEEGIQLMKYLVSVEREANRVKKRKIR